MLMRKPNKVREKLARGQCVTGTAIYSNSPIIVEAAGYAGIDFIRIDTEHAWRRDDSLDHMIRAAVIADVVPIVRIDREDPYLVRKALEVGAGGIIVPHATTVQDVKDVVSASKFPPAGIRGFGSLCQSGEWGRWPSAEWIKWSDTQPVIGVMIESVKAMDAIDEMLAVDGLDFVLFGPSDYSMSLGLEAPQPSHPKVQEGLRRTIQSAKAAGKHVMYGVGLGNEGIERGLEMGVTMLEFAHDVAIVRGVLSARVSEFGSRTS